MSPLEEHDVARKYDRLAADYDSRWSSYVARSLGKTMNGLELLPGMRILDVGCGTGRLLVECLRRQPELELTGLDLSPGMLAVARHRAGNRGRLIRGSALRLPFDDGSFHLVLSTSSFHYFAEPQDALLEMFRVLRPGGTIRITDWCGDYLLCRIYDRLSRLLRPEHHDVYTSRQCHTLLGSTELREIEVRRYRIDLFWGLMTATGQRPAEA